MTDPLEAELEANNTIPIQTIASINYEVGKEVEQSQKINEGGGQEAKEESKVVEKSLEISEISLPLENTHLQELTLKRSEEGNSSLTTIEDIVLLDQHSPKEGTNLDFDFPIWIHQNIIKFGKEFNVDIKGCKEEAMVLFMKVDNMRQNNLKKEEAKIKTTPTVKGSKEPKSLECGSNFRGGKEPKRPSTI